MNGDISLPFGATDVTVEQVEQAVDLDATIKEARRGGVDDADRMRAFIGRIPELLCWLEQNGRDYPWRTTTDPWEVYLAEVLLQRTRGDAVAQIYPEVLEQFPNPESLNEATDEVVREAIRSLGFVNHRQRSLNEAARLFTEESGGSVPDSVADLKEPWRIGDYTARATQLFARGQPLALVDSNFARVVGRVLGYEMPQQPHKSEAVYALLEALTPDDPGMARSFALAILDLGALVCTPDNPRCESCPLNVACAYYQSPGK